MVPFVAGVLSGMAIQKVLGGSSTGESQPIFEPVEMREVSAEYVEETLSKSNRSKKLSAREISVDELPQYIRDKLAASN